jgi:hypothetical protein
MNGLNFMRHAFYPIAKGLLVLLSIFLVSCSKPDPDNKATLKLAVNPELAQVQQQIQAAQKKMETLYPQLVEVESAARTNHPPIQALFDEMTAKRAEYQAKLNELPEMKALHEQLELNQAEMGMLLERQKVLVTPENKQ